MEGRDAFLLIVVIGKRGKLREAHKDGVRQVTVL